jgi:two-component system NarL family sensor kinase
MTTDPVIFIFIVGTAILLLFAVTLIIFLIIHKKKRYEHLLEKQQLENSYQNQLLLSRIEVQEQSFKYFSEEIHDNIGQVLSIAKMQLHGIKSGSSEPDIVKRSADSIELIGKAITDLRNISHTFNTAFVASAGLADAIEKDLEYVRSAKNVQCTLHVSGDEYSLGSERELLLFRIVQEAMTNALKHAAPSTIDVYLGYTPAAATVAIADNGTGFDIITTRSTGIGLSNMHQRAGLLNGALHINSEKDKGTTITLQVANLN